MVPAPATPREGDGPEVLDDPEGLVVRAGSVDQASGGSVVSAAPEARAVPVPVAHGRTVHVPAGRVAPADRRGAAPSC